MYLWIVIATFIVALFSYNISVHPDVDRMYSETRANTVVASFQIQHNALVLYIQSKKGHLKNEQTPQSGEEEEEGEEEAESAVSNATYMSGAYYAKNKFQNAGTLNESEVVNFLPPGFEMDEQVTSKIYCFERYAAPLVPQTGEEDEENATDGPTADPVTGAYPFDYTRADAPCIKTSKVVLVSWRKIPQKWINYRNSSLPAPDMMHSIARSNGYGTTFGYTIHPNQTDFIISGGDQKVYEAIAQDSTTPNLKETCSKEPCFIAVNQIKN